MSFLQKDQNQLLYPLELDQVIKIFNDVSFPESISEETIDDALLQTKNVFKIVDKYPESIPAGYKAEKMFIEFIDDKWVQNYNVISLSYLDHQTIKNTLVRNIQQRLDQFAQTRNYDNILSASTYATSHIPKFAQEGQYAVQQRDATWAKLLEILDQVESGTRAMPQGYQDIESGLPTLVWPT